MHFHLFFLPVQQCNILVTRREPLLSLSILFWTWLNNHLVVLTTRHKPYDFLVLGSWHYSYQCFGGVDSIHIAQLIYWRHKCIFENIYVHTYIPMHIFLLLNFINFYYNYFPCLHNIMPSAYGRVLAYNFWNISLKII